MDYDALEAELVGVLNTYFGANNIVGSDPVALYSTVYQARQMPQNQSALLQSYDFSLVNVLYADSVYGDPKSTADRVQDEQIKIVCFLQCNAMSGPTGGYNLIAQVKNALLGYRPNNATTRMWISNYGDWRIEDGQLNPYIEFSFRTVAQQVIDDNDPVLDGTGLLAGVDSDLYVNGEGPLETTTILPG